jgi:hypothetical protein
LRKEELVFFSSNEETKDEECAWKVLEQTVPMGWYIPFFPQTYFKQSGVPRQPHKCVLMVIMKDLIEE